MKVSANKIATHDIESSYLSSGPKYLLDALNNLLQDDIFKLDPARVKKAVETAERMVAWMEQCKMEATFFQGELLVYLSSARKRETVWSNYHHLRTSEAYVNFWRVLLTEIGPGMTHDPVFFQHISHHIFTQLLQDRFPLPASTDSATLPTMTFEEANAIRYVGGYVCAKLYKKLKKSTVQSQ